MNEPKPLSDPNDLNVLLALYANQLFTIGLLRDAAEDVLKGIVPHPKYQHKTRLVWAAEIDNLRSVLGNTAGPSPLPEEVLRRHGLPTPEQAKQMVRWVRGMMQLNEPEQKELREKLEKLGTPEAAP